MTRKILFMFILVALLLSACGGNTSQTASTPTAAAAAVEPTSAEPQTEAGAPAAPAANTVQGPQGPAECRVVDSLLPKPEPGQEVGIPTPNDKDWSIGPSDAVLTIVEYSDFQCPYCQLAAPSIAQFQEEHADEVRFIFRHFPLDFHDKSLLGVQAAEAAGLQGKFWEMHDLLFLKSNWDVWTAKTPEDFIPWIKDNAGSIEGLDVKKFASDLTSDEIVNKAKALQKEAITLSGDQKNQLSGTPTTYLVIDGVMYPASPDPAMLANILDVIKLDAKRFSACPEMTVDPKKEYTATLKTEKGDITIKLFPDKAPMAVNSFIFLAKAGWFDNVTFHRVLENFVAQSGDPSASGIGGPGYEFDNEIDPNLKFDHEGVLGMANAGANTNGSQFFITLGSTPNLDGSYTIFGEVIEGMDVVKKLTLRDPSQGGDLPAGDKILSVTITEK